MDWQEYGTAFAWEAAGAAKDFGTFKGPLVDIIQGKPYVVWHACVALIARLQQTSPGIDIPEADKPRVRETVWRYYAKFGKTPPAAGGGDGTGPAAPLTPEQASVELDRLAKLALGPQAAQASNDLYAGALRDVLAQRRDLAVAAGYAAPPAPPPVKPRPGLTPEQASVELDCLAKARLGPQAAQAGNDAYAAALNTVLAEHPDLAAAYHGH
jgi:hypothetical protein